MMSSCFRALIASAFLCGGWLVLVSPGSVLAQSPSSDPAAGSSRATGRGPSRARRARAINVLEGLRSGQIAADAQGLGDGRMELSLTNRTKRQLRVVLPPGLIA